jgi:hypothetical protein
VAVETLQELVVDLRKSVRLVDKSSVDQSVQVAGFLVEFQELLISQVLFVGTSWRQDHFEALLELVFSKSIVQSVEILMIFDEGFLDFDHVLVAFETAEPLHPAHVA